jgi:hypothetical protein
LSRLLSRYPQHQTAQIKPKLFPASSKSIQARDGTFTPLAYERHEISSTVTEALAGTTGPEVTKTIRPFSIPIVPRYFRFTFAESWFGPFYSPRTVIDLRFFAKARSR